MLGRSFKLAFHSTALILVGTFTLGFMLALHAVIWRDKPQRPEDEKKTP